MNEWKEKWINEWMNKWITVYLLTDPTEPYSSSFQ